MHASVKNSEGERVSVAFILVLAGNLPTYHHRTTTTTPIKVFTIHPIRKLATIPLNALTKYTEFS